MKLSGVMIGSEQPDVLGAFYEKVLGKAGWHQDNWYGFGDETSALVVGPHSEVSGKNQDAPRLMITITSSNVSGDFDAFVAAGAEVVAKPYNPDESNETIWLATVSDPDGNYVQLASPWTA